MAIDLTKEGLAWCQIRNQQDYPIDRSIAKRLLLVNGDVLDAPTNTKDGVGYPII